MRFRVTRRGEGGQALVEFVVIAPLLLMLFMGAVDVGRLLFTYTALEEAAQEGALFRSHEPTASVATVRARVQTSSNHGEVAAATVTVPACTSTTVTVTASYPLPLLTPIGSQLFGGTFTVSATVIGTNFKGSC